MMMGMDELTGPVSCWNGGGSSVGDDYENESVIDLLDIFDFPAECLEGDGFGDDFDESQLGPIPSDAFTASIHVPHAFIRNESSSAAFKLNASQTNDPKPFLAQNKYSEFVMFQTHSPVSVLDSSASCLGGKAGPIKTDFTVPVRPRSKRARSSSVNPWLSISPIVAAKKKGKKKPSLKSALSEASSKKCKHCGVTKTPQWREGPQGPKTLCNACGVRYRSGRLFPEYRPAASPTFVPSLHSNSHRKVIEMRRKSMQEGGFQEDDPLLEFVPMNSHLFDCIY